MTLDGRVFVITGAAGGIGRATAGRLLREGALIIAVDLWSAGATEHAQFLEDLDGAATRVLLVDGDVRVLGDMEEAVAAGLRSFGRIDGAFVNAGVLLTGRALETSLQDWNSVIDINLTGAWMTAKAVAPAVIDGGRGGSIVITSSTSGLMGELGYAAYTTSKHGVVGLMRALAHELGPHSIRVNTVHPTSTNTPMVNNPENVRRVVSDENPASVESLERVYRSHHLLPVSWLDPIDVANAVVWLLSDESRYVTGVALPIDAGLLAR